jgi:acyl-homoserine-lactone acylase
MRLFPAAHWAIATLLAAAVPAAAAPSPDALRIAARAARTTIIRDEWGIAHVSGPSDSDAVFAMAYAQAEDDFHRVETNYLTSLGRLAEAEGETALWKDLRQRLWVRPEALKRDYAASPPWLKAVLTGWADGLNHYLATHRQVRPRVLTRFEPWMALSFSEGSIGGDIESVDLKALEGFYARGAAVPPPIRRREEPQGSNGIAIAPSRSASGHPLLLINPHTSFFFRDVVQVISGEGLNAYGAVTWGQPFIYQGFNRSLAWMHTSSGLDNRDSFAERVERRGGRLAYRYGRQWRAIAQRPVAIGVRQPDGSIATRQFTTFHTHHGPIVRAEEGKWIAFAIMDKPRAALEQSFLRTKAASIADFRAVSVRNANSSNNTLLADSAGNIAYLHPQFVPRRDDRFDYRGVVDGSDPATDWKGETPQSQVPTVLNPRSGFVYNSNDSPWLAAGPGTLNPKGFPRYFDQWGWNARSDHALALLVGTSKFTREGLRDVAYDAALPGFDRLLPQLFAAYDALAPGDPRRAALRDPVRLLRRWDRRWAKDSEAQSLAIHWGEILWKEVMAKDRPTDANAVAYQRMAAAPATRKLAALSEAMEKMTTLYGGWRVAWGEINRFQRNDGAIVQKFDDEKPSIAVGFPGADWGTLASFGARTYPGTTRRYGTSGNSFVAVVEMTPAGPSAIAVTAGGVNGDPASPHFLDQARSYAEGKLQPVHFTPADVAAHARETYRPGQPRTAR